jgi:hypothetical protein
MITREHIRELIAKLSAVFTPPKEASLTHLVDAWWEALQDVGEPGLLEYARQRYVREEGHYFPKPAALRRLALEAKARQFRASASATAHAADGQAPHCPRCGTHEVFTPLHFRARTLVRHAHDCLAQHPTEREWQQAAERPRLEVA